LINKLGADLNDNPHKTVRIISEEPLEFKQILHCVQDEKFAF